jgi:hypothetical protein
MKDGGPAFPTGYGERAADRGGMSLRDYFAGKAIQGAFSSPARIQFNGKECRTAEDYSAWAYDVAEKMLAQREKS